MLTVMPLLLPDAWYRLRSYIGWLHFLDQSVVETKDWDWTLIWTLKLAQLWF